MENKKNNIIKIIIAIILCIVIIALGIYIFLNTKENTDSSNNTTQQNETDPRLEYIIEPTGTGSPMTNMPVINDVPTNE